MQLYFLSFFSFSILVLPEIVVKYLLDYFWKPNKTFSVFALCVFRDSTSKTLIKIVFRMILMELVNAAARWWL